MERKVITAPLRQLVDKPDTQDMETLEAWRTEPKVPYYAPSDTDDEFVPLGDGGVTRVKTVNVNGFSYHIPVDVPTEIPVSIYELLEQARIRLTQKSIKPNEMRYFNF